MSRQPAHPQILDATATLQVPLSGARLIEASAGTGKTYAISNLYLLMCWRAPASTQFLS